MANLNFMFRKNKEDFICEQCGESVKGDGYTNHCPYCLYSKHVDVHPGDRASDCHGLMVPIDNEAKQGDLVLIHKCAKCGFIKRNKRADNDSLDSIQKINKKIIYG